MTSETREAIERILGGYVTERSTEALAARIMLPQTPAAGSDGSRIIEGLREAIADARIKHMVDRFLNWKLPENFNPDAGISFKPDFNEHTAHPMKHKPVGTNLFDYTQATAMVRHMVEGLAPPPVDSSLRDGWVLARIDAEIALAGGDEKRPLEYRKYPVPHITIAALEMVKGWLSAIGAPSEGGGA